MRQLGDWGLRMAGGIGGVLLLPAMAVAAEHPPIELPFWTVIPFVALLLTIAILPLVAEHFWHRNRNKALVTVLFAAPVAAYLFYLGPTTHGASTEALTHEMQQYASFIILLGSLYTVAGGIFVQCRFPAHPLTNSALLGVGAVLANFIGTTGASMLLIRPMLRINRQRRNVIHVPIFFIFIVSNLGGLLTPLGDPPLFLGFLRGVDFFWTFRLWPQWLVAVGSVLLIFLVWDTIAFRREKPHAHPLPLPDILPPEEPPLTKRRLEVHGYINVLFLAGILAGVLLQSEELGANLAGWLAYLSITVGNVSLGFPEAEITMVVMALLSLVLTPRAYRQANDFNWSAITEVAVLFAGIFVTMVPALQLLSQYGHHFSIDQPRQYFWLTGVLSSFLDNAPTYVTFATLAGGSSNFSLLANNQVAGIAGAQILQAISCGAVFMGANTYIGNGPNFMVKAMAEASGFRTPSFFGYLLYSIVILLPVFVLITVLFF
ncbi:MAG: sodium:proton antiporter [Gemmataceae bacterium]